ncbi:MAG TPA: family 78 glycoside hydrolase catalytic domain, partial [Bacteroidales bacterium]|nr:family 78 glycoside hydrolase catalytic domain [Bacteroidales bacterium]
ILGNGWYNPLPLRVFGRNLRKVLTIGQPVLRCQMKIEYEDGTSETVVSDESWKTSESPIVRNNIYLGEWYDAQMEQPGWDTPAFNDKKWKKAHKAEGPAGKLTWEYIPPVRQFQTLHPVQIMEPKPGVYVYDLGQNYAGDIRFRSQTPAGTEIVFRYAEIINPDYSINVNTTAAGQIKHPGQGGPGAPDVAWQEDRYISKGEGVVTFEPRFIFHGFRYVEVTGLPYKPSLNDLEGLVLHSDIKDVSEFACSNELFNKIQHITEWAMLSNVFSVESDCPAREKFGYGGDMVTASEAFMNNFDMSTFYQKSVRDFERDARDNGGMTECAPDNSINERGLEPGTGPVGWTLAHPFLLWQLYKYYGNIDIVKEQYPAMKKLVDFYHERTPDNLIMDGIGDHNSVDERPRPVSATSAYYHHAIILARFAKILGKKDDAKKYSQLAEDIKQAFIDKFVDKETGKVYTGYEADQVFALYYDLLPDSLRRKAMQQLLNEIKIDRHGHLTTGIFSTKMMLNYLSDHGRDDISFLMLNQKEFPGYGYMIDNGATTLWENWGFKLHDSKNHPMFGSVSEWFYKSVLGIQQSENSVAYSDIVIKPSVVGDLTWAKGSIHSMRGKISSSWWRFGDDIHLEVTIPANTTATIHVPVLGNATPDIYEGNVQVVSKGESTGKDAEVKITGLHNDAAVFRVGAGTYRFVVR